MHRRISTWLTGLLIALGAPAAAQLALPALPRAGDLLRDPLGVAGQVLSGTQEEVSGRLRQLRIDRIDTFLRANRGVVDRDADGEPARKDRLLIVAPTPADIDAAAALGFSVLAVQQIDGLDLKVVELKLPSGLGLAKAERALRAALPNAEITADQIHFQSGSVPGRPTGFNHPAVVPVELPVGIVDGAPGQPVNQLQGFAAGAPKAGNHGSAVVSLARWAGARNIMVADVYGTDPAGGSALAISRALGWLSARGARVISLSLVGPRNSLVERAIAAVQGRGIVVVAAVGNDGAAAPPSYPASYPGVIAVTGVDRRNRPLIEAGRSLHLDYAAPGADIVALDAGGKSTKVRGTSFATPLVAVRAALALQRGASAGAVRNTLDREAVPLSKRMPDPDSGRGLICGVCR